MIPALSRLDEPRRRSDASRSLDRPSRLPPPRPRGTPGARYSAISCRMSANRSPYELLDACKESTVGADPNLTIVGRPIRHAGNDNWGLLG